MSAQDELIAFEIYSQQFKLRAAPDEREAIERVATEVDKRIRENKRHASSDMRAALMTAYELCFERDERPPSGPKGQDPAETLASIEEAADQLLTRIDKEMDFTLDPNTEKNNKKQKQEKEKGDDTRG